MTTQPILDAASAELGYEITSEQVTAQQIRDTQVIQLAVEDQHPERAAAIANVLIEQLISQNETFQSGRFSSAEASLRDQIQQMESSDLRFAGGHYADLDREPEGADCPVGSPDRPLAGGSIHPGTGDRGAADLENRE